MLDQLIKTINSTPTDAVVFSDFRHGIFDRATVSKLVSAIPPSVYRVADSQVATRWGNITDFPEFDLITPNEREARFALADQDATVGTLAGMLKARTKCRLLILKLGERGIFTLASEKRSCINDHFSIDSFAGRVVDAVGSGDALLAYATMLMMSSGSEVIASILGSMAAACECELDGNIPIKPVDVMAKIDMAERLAEYNGE